ncbi:OsmC family protein [Ornithinimicrobium humiphilum]|uniref:Putative OsmC-like protein n=1 Tax=Ornithinimicrobium humiphilum TaxID=125288 RepID=A0A543KNW8_9MICO|nr:OsmC family protein [Ornithinimicrobium humiphilum]TQM96779.1 putative OsmC-like protein [Ornithinimicrobium humiphilum]
MAGDATRSVSLTRTGAGTFLAENARGGTIPIGAGGSDAADFTPVELLLAAIAGCSAVDIDALTSRLAEPVTFSMSASGDKLSDEQGNHMGPITVTVSVTFPEGEGGDRARDRLPDVVTKSRDRLCTVSRTVQLPTEVHFEVD